MANSSKTAPKRNAEVEPVSGQLVKVSSLETLQLFEFKGHIYSKRRVCAGGVTGLSEKGDKLIRLPPDTLVKV